MESCSCTNINYVLNLIASNKDIRGTLQLDEVFKEDNIIVGCQFSFEYSNLDIKFGISMDILNKSWLKDCFGSEIEYRVTTDVVSSDCTGDKKVIYRVSDCVCEKKSRFDWELSDLEDVSYKCIGKRKFNCSDAVILNAVPLMLD